MGQHTLLVVENDQLLRELYADYFKNEHFTVDTAAIGEETEGKLKQGRWDVVLLDLGLSRLDVFSALETYKHAAASSAAKHQPVFIAILLYDDQVEKARQLVDGVFVKTHFTPGDVLEKAQECLQQRRDLQSAAPAA